MKKRKHFFNMVEVALALLVISLGLSTVLTLFPAGLKATREAENANNLVEAAEYIYSYLQAQISANLQAQISANGWSQLQTASNTGSTYNTSTNDDRIEALGNGIYLYRKAFAQVGGSAYIEDFSCVIRLLDADHGVSSGNTSDTYVMSVPWADTSGSGVFQCTDINNATCSFRLADRNMSIGAQSGVTIEDIVKVYNVELSYPVNAPYLNRTKRVYRMVFLNPDYRPYIP